MSALHRSTGRWRLGLLLSLITTVTWGVLPIGLKLILEGMDPGTITWYRFLMATVFTAAVLARSGRLPDPRKLPRASWALLAIAAVGLCGNYICYLMGLDRMTASSAQIIIQLGPLFLLLGSLVVFREPFSRIQGWGVVVLIVGMGLFFNQRLGDLFGGMGDYAIGAMLIVTAAAVWSCYALAQKQLLKTFSSAQILLMLYAFALLAFTPMARPATIVDLNGLQLFMLLFCGANVIVAYWCFTESLAHWEASRVSAVLALVPLLTLLFVELCEAFAPSIAQSEGLNLLGWVGTGLVVVGSIQCALGRSSRPDEALPLE